MPPSNGIELDVLQTVIVAIVVLYIGQVLTTRISFLQTFNIPEAVTGGLLCSFGVALLFSLFDRPVSFDLTLRDVLLLIFFSTIGLSAKISTLINGGKSLALLVVCAVAFLVLQDLVGVIVAISFGSHPAYGLLAGSIAFAGGHGSAISYGQLAADQGLPGAIELGLACATFGLVAGGLVGGPIAKRLITYNELQGQPYRQAFVPGPEETEGHGAVTLNGMLNSLFLLAICLSAGAAVNDWIGQHSSVPLPGFLTAMFVGIIITNCCDFAGVSLDKPSISLCSDVSLQLLGSKY